MDLSGTVASLMGMYRSMAFDAIEEMLVEAFSDLGAVLVSYGRQTGETLPPGRSLCGLSGERIGSIVEHSMPGCFDQYYSALPLDEKKGWMMCFMGFTPDMKRVTKK